MTRKEVTVEDTIKLARAFFKGLDGVVDYKYPPDISRQTLDGWRITMFYRRPDNITIYIGARPHRNTRDKITVCTSEEEARLLYMDETLLMFTAREESPA